MAKTQPIAGVSNVVLYKKVGRADPQPIGSWDHNDSLLGDNIAAVKALHLQDAIRSGCQTPVFTVEGLPNA